LKSGLKSTKQLILRKGDKYMRKLLITAALLFCLQSYAAEAMYEVCIVNDFAVYSILNANQKCFDSINVPEIQGAFIKFLDKDSKTMFLSGTIVARRK